MSTLPPDTSALSSDASPPGELVRGPAPKGEKLRVWVRDDASRLEAIRLRLAQLVV